MVLSLKI